MKRLICGLVAALLVLSSPAAIAGGDLGYPTDAFALTGASGNVAAAAATSTLTATAGLQ
jgi:hypothetical protein